MTDRTYVLYFTGKDDPRDCIIIGEDTKPVYVEFQTPSFYMAETRTTVSCYQEGQNSSQVYRGDKNTVAFLDWTMGVHLGRVTIQGRQMAMPDMLLPGSSEHARRFYSFDGRAFEWRRNLDEPNAYDLYLNPNTKVAAFRRLMQLTPVGPSHGFLCYTFDHGGWIGVGCNHERSEYAYTVTGMV